jgi:hypothetical protein
MATANKPGNFLNALNSLSFFNQPQPMDVVEVRDLEGEEKLYQQALDHLLIDYMSLGEPMRARLREFIRIDEVVTPLTLKNVIHSLQTVLNTVDVNCYDKGDYVEVIVYYDNNTTIHDLLEQFKPTNIPVMDSESFDWYFTNRNMDFDYILKYIFHQLGNYTLQHEMKFNDLFSVQGSIPIVVNTYIDAPNLSAIIQHFQFDDARQVSITRNNELTDEDQGNVTTLQFNFSFKANFDTTVLTLHQATLVQPI